MSVAFAQAVTASQHYQSAARQLRSDLRLTLSVATFFVIAFILTVGSAIAPYLVATVAVVGVVVTIDYANFVEAVGVGQPGAYSLRWRGHRHPFLLGFSITAAASVLAALIAVASS